MKKRGYSLVELVVAMAILIIVITLAVGAFITVSRMKALTSTMKESQQKTRIAMEMITRLARQAEKVVVSADGKTLDLYFNLKKAPYGTRFAIKDTDANGKLELIYAECSGSLTCLDTTTGGTNLYSKIDVQTDSKFIKNGSIPPTLDIRIYGNIGDLSTNKYYSDKINLNTTIVLEGIK